MASLGISSLWHRGALVGALCLAAFASCAGSSRVILHTSSTRSSPIWGQEVVFEALPTQGYVGFRDGYFVVKRADDWFAIWENDGTKAKSVPPVPSVDFGQQMLIVVATPAGATSDVQITRAIKRGQTVHLYAEELAPVASCAKADGAARMAIASVPLFEEVHVHADKIADETCRPPPSAKVQCRQPGQAFAESLATEPGQKIDCSALDSKALGIITDRTWFLELAPHGSIAKLSIARDGIAASIVPDTYGKYIVRVEVADEEQKRGSATATIETKPPSGTTVVQIGWAKFDRSDDASVFPKVELIGVELPGYMFSNATCRVDSPKPWCESKTVAGLDRFFVRPEGTKRYRFAIRYLEERFRDSPLACVRVFLSNGKASQLCDDVARKPGTVWEAGTLNFESGALLDSSVSFAPAPKVVPPKPGAKPIPKPKPVPKPEENFGGEL